MKHRRYTGSRVFVGLLLKVLSQHFQQYSHQNAEGRDKVFVDKRDFLIPCMCSRLQKRSYLRMAITEHARIYILFFLISETLNISIHYLTDS